MTWLLQHPDTKKSGAAPKKRASAIVIIICRAMPLPVTEQGLVLRSRTHWAYREPIETVAVAYEIVVRKEVDAPRAVRAVTVERT